ncbi:MAG: tRNA preQ1(34) S-adenosylmethionine ribosyltransferase-isomerase QueA [Planctomycetota bacterium]
MELIDDYDYELPRELIAQEPTPNRVDARLMVVDRDRGSFEHHHIRDLPEVLRAGDTLVMNDSKVVPARLMGYRTQTRGLWQGLFLRGDPTTGLWEVLTKTRGKLASGETITIRDRDGRDAMRLEVVTRTDSGGLLVRPLAPDDSVGGMPDDLSLDDPPDRWLEKYGRVPIPPYIRDGRMMDSDVVDYQTVYADRPGSVAAPTAGLHFTKPLIEQIRQHGIATFHVTLHVGIGTFRPISVKHLKEHQMHEEIAEIDAETVQAIRERRARGRTIAVGTTSVRVLETAAADGKLQPFSGPTDLFIRPPYQFHAVDALMTNFHLPKSSLLVMISAFAGRDLILESYREAIRNDYRFYSYGDAMLIV